MDTAPVIALDHPAALDAARVGRKAAALAEARAAGLPVGPGVVLTTAWSPDDHATAAQVWRVISHDGAIPLVVRPSAPGRDRRRAAHGVVEPVLTARDAEAFRAAVAAVHGAGGGAVLIQPFVDAPWRGVLFGDDRRTGRGQRPLVAAVGRTAASDGGWVAELDHRGRVRDVLTGQHLGNPPAEVLARLIRLADRVTEAFGGPQDIEWAADDRGTIHLLRVRPVVRLTTAAGFGDGVRPGAVQASRRAMRACRIPAPFDAAANDPAA